jgi:hypothetical protein
MATPSESSQKSGDATSGSASGSGKLSGNSIAASVAADFGDRSGITLGPQSWQMGIFAKNPAPAFPFGMEGLGERFTDATGLSVGKIAAALAVVIVVGGGVWYFKKTRGA